MESVNVSSCRCCMYVSCVHPVTVLNAAFCMTYSVLMLVEGARGDHMKEAYSSNGGPDYRLRKSSVLLVPVV